MTTKELVRYTFEALQAWPLEFGLPCQAQQTPIEFAGVIGESFPEIASDALQVARHANNPEPNSSKNLLITNVSASF